MIEDRENLQFKANKSQYL